MDALKEEIQMKIIHPLTHPDLYKAYGKTAGGGILLYGPPGCGKAQPLHALVQTPSGPRRMGGSCATITCLDFVVCWACWAKLFTAHPPNSMPPAHGCMPRTMPEPFTMKSG